KTLTFDRQRRWRWGLALTIGLLFGTSGLTAQVLNPGDIAFTGFHSDDPDDFSFLLLAPVVDGTVIYFTDNGWQSGSLYTNEGTITATFTQDVPCGTEIYVDIIPLGGTGLRVGFSTVGTVSVAGNFGLAGSGDQILAYQGSSASPNFIAALNYDGAGWTGSASGSNQSALPAGLTDGVNAVSTSPERQNGQYDCGETTSGSIATLRSALFDDDNWDLDNDRHHIDVPAGCNFCIDGCSGTPVTLSAGDIAFTGFHTEGDDDFSFLLLTDVPAGTVIYFTDAGWQDGEFYDDENHMVGVFTEDVDCGTEIYADFHGSYRGLEVNNTYVGTLDGSLNLSDHGDQILAYQGSECNPTFIAAIDFDGIGAWDATATDGNESELPPGLIDGISAVGLTSADNGQYDCDNLTTGTAVALLGAVNNAANWDLEDDSEDIDVPSDCEYEVTDCVDCPAIAGTLGNSGPACANESVSLTLAYTTGQAPFMLKITELNGGDWIYGGPGEFWTFNDPNNPFSATLAPGTHTFHLTDIKDANGCEVNGLTQETTITVHALPTGGTLTNDGPACPGAIVNLLFTGEGGLAPYTIQIAEFGNNFNYGGAGNGNEVWTFNDPQNPFWSLGAGEHTYTLTAVKDDNDCVLVLDPPSETTIVLTDD
ncbi:MAG: hypothetical protein KDC54_03320, partial [Lewinella sp.]|nr:hypothetical protein [Lewinella sp.]